MSKSSVKTCYRCKQEKPLTEFSPWKRSKDGRYTYCRPCAASYARELLAKHPERVRARYAWTNAYKRSLRLAALVKYSGGGVPRCACCGETRLEFLALDHVNNDGAIHRKSVSTANLPAWLRRNNYPPGFQVLCHNCNNAKAYYGSCPHQDGGMSDAA